MVYQWKTQASGVIGLDAQACGEALEAVQATGPLTPPRVVEIARPDTSPLHHAFEWDDEKAAQAHREEQARYLLRSIVIVREGQEDTRPIRAFVHVSDADAEGKPQSVYTDITTALRNPVLRAQVLRKAESELVAWRRRYQELEELAAVFAVVDARLTGDAA